MARTAWSQFSLREGASLVGTQSKAVIRNQEVCFVVSGRTYVLCWGHNFMWFNSESHEGKMLPCKDSQCDDKNESGTQTRKAFTAKVKQGYFPDSFAPLLFAICNLLSPFNVPVCGGLCGQDAVSPNKLACCRLRGMTSHRPQKPRDHHPRQAVNGNHGAEERSPQMHEEVRVALASSLVRQKQRQEPQWNTGHVR